MNASNKYANLGAVIGIVAGSLSWMIVFGFVVGTPLVSCLVAALGIIAGVAAFKLLAAYDQRRLSIMGALIALMVSVNLFFLNNFYDRIPSSMGGITTGKECVSLCSLNSLLAAFMAAGLALIVIDIAKRPR